ncbi:Hypothetical protein GLP15_1058 [Giardia lamblia P15]|uniref:Uncharacterized protein n=1 Tax=Giardia intestinalis (strain P15) TaxID=658858 RepID=E1F2X9_GIAIA|nr:Hypothetical protein GLP15_1058 [Giardia lamblia P15]
MPIFSIVDAHIDPAGSIQAVVQKVNDLSDDSLESEAKVLGAYLQIIFSAETVPKDSIQSLFVALDKRCIDPVSCRIRLPLCIQALGETLRDALSTLNMEHRNPCDRDAGSSIRISEVVCSMLCYSISACISLSQSIGLRGLIRTLDTYLPEGPTFDFIIQHCLSSKFFTPDVETLLSGVDTLCSRGRYATLSASISVSNTSTTKNIITHLLIHHPHGFFRTFATSLEIEGHQASTLLESFTLEALARQMIKRYPCDTFSISTSWIDAFVTYIVESTSDLTFMAAFSSCFFTWILHFHSISLSDFTVQDIWAFTLLDRLVTVMTMCTRATERFLRGMCTCLAMLVHTEVAAFIFGQVNRPQSASLGAELNLIVAILMKLVKAIRMFMQVSPALESHQLLLIDTAVPYIQALILSDRDAASKQLDIFTDSHAVINMNKGFADSLAARNDLLLHIVTNNITLQGVTDNTLEQGSTLTLATHSTTTDDSNNINLVSIASASRIASTSLSGLLTEVLGQEPIPGDLLSSLHKAIPKSLEEAISLLQYPSGQPQSRYYHILSLASLPLLIKSTSQIIIISKVQELLDSILWLDDIATLQTIKGKSAWHALKAQSISSAIEKAPYIVGTTLIERSLQKHKATVGGFMVGLSALTEASHRLTARQALCLISTFNNRSQIFFYKVELTEPTFFTLTSLVDIISRSTDRQALCCVPLCCDNYADYVVRKCLLSANESASESITKGERLFISTLIHACAQTTGALKLLLLEFFKRNNTLKQLNEMEESSLPSSFFLASTDSLGQALKSFSTPAKLSRLSEEGCDISIGNIIHNTSVELADHQMDYSQSLQGFNVIDKITQMLSSKSPIDVECRILLREAAENILSFFGFKEYGELLLKKINCHQS